MPEIVLLLKKRLRHRCFSVNFAKFVRGPFYRTLPGDCFCMIKAKALATLESFLKISMIESVFSNNAKLQH